MIVHENSPTTMEKTSFAKYTHIFSWVADGLLILFALSIFIAFGSGMSPTMAVILALSIFLGGLLPLGAHLLDYFFAKLNVKERESSAPHAMREIASRLDSLLARIEDTAADAARTTLTARQIPSQIQASTDRLEKAKSDLAALIGVMDKLPTSSSVSELAGKLEPHERVTLDLEPLLKRFAALEGEIEKALLVREDKLEEIIDQLQQFEETMDSLEGAPRPPGDMPEPPTVTTTPEPLVAKPQPTTKKNSPAKPAQNAQADLFAVVESDDGSDRSAPTALVAKAMVGVSNKLFIRGDAPLSWDEGVALNPTGIGEWRIDFEDINAPFEVEIRLNDDIAAKGPTIRIEPGKIAHVSPVFPTDNEPF